MYRRILVPVDGSDASTCGLKEAIKLARGQDSQLRLLHVVSEFIIDYSAAGLYAGNLIEILHQAGREILREAESMVRTEGLEPETKLRECIGHAAANLIIAEAMEWPADLIVMGTHGRHGIRRIALGSDAEQVMRTASVPVLLVRGMALSGSGAKRSGS